MANKLTYSEAVAELEKILAELDSNAEINMELISEKVKRAAVLIEIAKSSFTILILIWKKFWQIWIDSI